MFPTSLEFDPVTDVEQFFSDLTGEPFIAFISVKGDMFVGLRNVTGFDISKSNLVDGSDDWIVANIKAFNNEEDPCYRQKLVAGNASSRASGIEAVIDEYGGLSCLTELINDNAAQCMEYDIIYWRAAEEEDASVLCAKPLGGNEFTITECHNLDFRRVSDRLKELLTPYCIVL